VLLLIAVAQIIYTVLETLNPAQTFALLSANAHIMVLVKFNCFHRYLLRCVYTSLTSLSNLHTELVAKSGKWLKQNIIYLRYHIENQRSLGLFSVNFSNPQPLIDPSSHNRLLMPHLSALIASAHCGHTRT